MHERTGLLNSSDRSLFLCQDSNEETSGNTIQKLPLTQLTFPNTVVGKSHITDISLLDFPVSHGA